MTIIRNSYTTLSGPHNRRGLLKYGDGMSELQFKPITTTVNMYMICMRQMNGLTVFLKLKVKENQTMTIHD